ncbi:MAG: hypothetical protein ACJAT2_000085 [Bacteriovoracaceae bacterium]|jgi:hypothetical protein
MKIILLILFLSNLSVSNASSFKLSDSFIEELMCLHNMDEGLCRKWISEGSITLKKYRKIEQGCLNGTQFLCTYVVYVQDKMPTPMMNEMIAMAEFGCRSGNGVHCLILASIDKIKRREYLKKGCDYNEPLACQRYSKLKNIDSNGKIKFNKEAFEKNIKDAFNKMLKGSKK